MNLTALEDQLIRHESMELTVYKDSVGILTIGVGRNLEHVGLRSEAEARYLLRSDILAIKAELDSALPWVKDLDDVRQRCLLNMAFNLGVRGLTNFTRTLRFVSLGQYGDASKEMLLSKWANQVGNRAKELSSMMATGKD